jgi:hypothetical protein
VVSTIVGDGEQRRRPVADATANRLARAEHLGGKDRNCYERDAGDGKPHRRTFADASFHSRMQPSD